MAASETVTLEDELRAIVRRKLTTGGDIDLNMKLADAGLDSLDLVEIAFDVEDKYRIQLPPLAGQATDVTLMDLYRLVEEKLAAKAEPAMDKQASESSS
jgi:acyl carrier protein